MRSPVLLTTVTLFLNYIKCKCSFQGLLNCGKIRLRCSYSVWFYVVRRKIKLKKMEHVSYEIFPCEELWKRKWRTVKHQTLAYLSLKLREEKITMSIQRASSQDRKIKKNQIVKLNAKYNRKAIKNTMFMIYNWRVLWITYKFTHVDSSSFSHSDVS